MAPAYFKRTRFFCIGPHLFPQHKSLTKHRKEPSGAPLYRHTTSTLALTDVLTHSSTSPSAVGRRLHLQHVWSSGCGSIPIHPLEERSRPFARVQCPRISPNLLRYAFAGATRRSTDALGNRLRDRGHGHRSPTAAMVPSTPARAPPPPHLFCSTK